MVTFVVWMTYTMCMMDTKLLGRNVLLSRRDLEMTQDELAGRAGVSRSYIAKIERGRARNLSIELVFVLADALRVNAAWLLGLSSDPLGGEVDLDSENYVVIDVEDPDQRRFIREALDALTAMRPENQRLATRILRTIRQEEELRKDQLLS